MKKEGEKKEGPVSSSPDIGLTHDTWIEVAISCQSETMWKYQPNGTISDSFIVNLMKYMATGCKLRGSALTEMFCVYFNGIWTFV